MTYPDVENATMDLLEAAYDQLAPTGAVRRVDSETPPNLQELLADDGMFVRVELVTGADDGVTDYSVVDIEVFADSRDLAYAFSEDIRSRLTGSPHLIGSVVLDRIKTEEKPRRLPWADENIRRFGATYRISARR